MATLFSQWSRGSRVGRESGKVNLGMNARLKSAAALALAIAAASLMTCISTPDNGTVEAAWNWWIFAAWTAGFIGATELWTRLSQRGKEGPP